MRYMGVLSDMIKSIFSSEFGICIFFSGIKDHSTNSIQVNTSSQYWLFVNSWER